MANRRVTATEFSRNFSAILSEVRYQGLSLEVWRGREMVARVVPPESPVGFPVDQLEAFFAGLPRLGEDASAFLSDLDKLDTSLDEPVDPWGS